MVLMVMVLFCSGVVQLWRRKRPFLELKPTFPEVRVFPKPKLSFTLKKITEKKNKNWELLSDFPEPAGTK